MRKSKLTGGGGGGHIGDMQLRTQGANVPPPTP